MPLADCRLYLLFTPELCVDRPWHTLEEALRGGVDLVQWRVKEPDPTGLQRCRELIYLRATTLDRNLPNFLEHA